jgi:hypothetical protein
MRNPFAATAVLGALLLGCPVLAPAQQTDGKSLAQPEHQQQADDAMNTPSGRAGKDEPGSHAPSQDAAVYRNGALNVPGAPTDGPTVPAKYSERNDALDKLPLLAVRLTLTDEQTRAILDGVSQDAAPVAGINPEVSTELPLAVALNDLPAAAADVPGMQGLKYVRLADRILLVQPGNRIVVGQIAM